MKINIKYALLIAAGLGMNNFAIAQNTSRDPQGEIVMTQQELESFLNLIAEKKREQMNKRKNELIINQKINDKFPASEEDQANMSDDRMYREFDRINSRIDMLMLSQGMSYNRNYMPAPGQQPSVIYQQRPQGYYDYGYQDNTQLPQQQNTTSAMTPTLSEEEMRLQNEINNLKEELRVLTLLSQGSNAESNAQYREEIDALNKRLGDLNSRVESSKPSNTVVFYNNDKLLKSLEDYKSSIYFGNNQTNIGPSDQAKLRELAATVMEHEPRITVVVRGFASKAGTAKYNNEISFKRAEAVKQVLLNSGLDAKHITILHHGVDNTSSADKARRVEVTLLVH